MRDLILLASLKQRSGFSHQLVDMKSRGIITLLTDFGYRDSYVGVMKGVILSINPDVQIVDLSHDVPFGDIETASFLLKGAYRFFPHRTVHTIIVDPGVGSRRRALAAKADNHLFVAPDNGVLNPILEGNDKCEVRHITNPKVQRPFISNTFHGRDVFAPVAAHLSLGVKLMDVGGVISDYQRLPIDQPAISGGQIIGQVVYIDHFGNLVTNICKKDIGKHFPLHQVQIRIGEQTIDSISSSYSDVSPQQLLAIIDSFGVLEIAVRDGNAARKLEVTKGCPISVGMLR